MRNFVGFMRLASAIFVSAMMTGEALAIACDVVFSNAVGTTGGKLDLKDNASLSNTGDRVLATGDLKIKGGSNHCDGEACIESGVNAPTLTIPSHATQTDLKDQSLVLAPGDHYFDKFELNNNNTVTLTGSGQVRVHVRGDLKITDAAMVNVDGNPLDLVFLVGGKVEIKDDSQVKAVIYSEDKIKVEDDVVIEGAIVGGRAEVKGDAQITYALTAPLEIEGVCELGTGQLDHFRMVHDGFGVPGVPETVTIEACTNSDCSQLYTGSVTVSLQPVNADTSWSGSGVLANQVTFTGGTQIVALNRTTAGTFNIGLSATPLPQNPTRCFVGTTETCSTTFASTAFVVTLPDQVSGGLSTGSVSVPTCWSDFQSKTVQVDVGNQYVSPAWTGPAATVNGTALPTDGSTAVVDLVFDANCVAPMQVAYADAGELGLTVGFVGSGSLNGLTMSGADNVVFYPADLIVQAENSSATPLNATTPGVLPVHPAGMGFNLTVTAVNSAGLVTQAYQPQAIDRLRAYVQRTGPTSGSEGTFQLSATGDVLTALNPPAGPGDYSASNVGPGDFVNGVYANANASYSEVGLVTLYLVDSDYMGHTIPASPIPIGRFVPDAFQVVPVIVNRAATAGCAGGDFTYMGEGLRLSVQLMAKNASGGITRNYAGAFAPFNGTGFTGYAGLPGNTLAARYLGTDLSGRLALDGVALSVPWAAGVARLDVDMNLQSATAADGPFDGTRLGLTFSDSDGVALQSLDMDVDGNGSMDHLDIGATDFRAGRLSVGNAHGSELRDLNVPVTMQFFAGPGLGFLTHTLDNCTPIASTLLADADTGDSLLVTDTCIVDQFGASGANACAAGTAGSQYRGTALVGEYVLSLKSPGAGKAGSLRVFADAPAWAEFDWISSGAADPVGIATFGIYNRNTDVIYQRELR